LTWRKAHPHAREHARGEAPTGAHLAGATVTIEPADKSAPPGRFTGCDPLSHVVLRPGICRVVARYAGLMRSKTIRVGKAATQATVYGLAASEP
jgi:hypothetical protein